MDESNPWLATTLRKRVGDSATAAHAAGVMDQLLRQVDDALTPVIGQRGVALLYRRALLLNVPAYPWMAAAEPATSHLLDFAPLRAVFEQQPSDAAVAGGSALLQSFYDLLSSLVGIALTEQLLRCVWANPPGGQSAQDK